MWIQTTFGSFCITQVEADRPLGMLTVSAHTQHCLEMLIQRFMPESRLEFADANAPQPFYIRAPQARIAAAMAQAVADIYYSDLISEVRLFEGDLQAKCYMGAEDSLYGIQYEQLAYMIQDFRPLCPTRERVLMIGVKGGDITLWSYEHLGQRGFSIAQSECFDAFIGEEGFRADTDDFCLRWSDVMARMPESWVRFYPLYVSEKFWPLISKELRTRGVEPTQDHDWLKAVQMPEVVDKKK